MASMMESLRRLVGHILVKRYLDEAREDQNICAVMDNERLETIAMHFYNLLLAAGVLNQIQINKAPMYNVLQLDLAYCWTHEVTPLTRHLSSVSCSLKSSTVKLWTSYMSKNPTSDKEELNYMMQEKILHLEQEIHRLRQEIENYKTLLRLQMVKPSDMVKLMICDTIGTKESNENINKTAQCDAETQTEGTNAAVGIQTNHDLQNYHAVKDSRIPKGNPEHPPALSTSIRLSPYSPPHTYPKSQSAVPLSPPRPPPLYTEITSLAKFGSSIPPHSSITGIAIPPPPPMPSIAIPPPPPMPSIAIPPPPPMPGTEVLPSPKKSSTAPAPQSMQSMVIPPPPPMSVMEVPSLLRSSSGAPLPPPMPGMVVPPPPPMPGMGIPALSPSSTIPGSSVTNLPPIPSTERGIPPPPQIAGHSESLLPSIPGMSVPPLPPPPPPPPHCRVTPKPPSFVGPVPLPPSPMGEWNAQKSAFKKPKVNPTVPMKPLYWTRILTTKAQMDSYSKPALWVEVEELPLENLPEFVELFSRQVITKKPPTKKVQHSSKVEPVKLLDSKRSRNVGILSQSLRVDVQEIENAIYNCDTSNVSLEALQQIYEARATTEELELIKSHTTAKPEVPLDKPEQFLYHLSEISHFAERISCLMFQVEFDDSISAIEHTLNNIKTTCDHLMNNPHLKDVMAIILTLGNYMNGGNISRGQADGFGLEILSKLRDVKSKDSKITLLHFIVKTYLSKIDNPLETNLPLPVPESDDVQRAASVNFDDTKLELQKLLKKLEDCEATSRRIIETATQEHLQPFKDRILEFIDQSNEHAIAELKFLEECRKLFEATMRFYWYKPKSGALETAAPDDFFRLWHSFCKDFKDIYKKELMRLQKQKIEQILIRERQRKSGIKKIKERPDGLKAKVRRLRQIKDKEREERDRDF